ncbi:MAG TPA: SCO family protein [Terriglobia bacterium]|nr:SCO family protein [Terriglobia bacterium]
MKNIWTIHKFIVSTAIIVASILTGHSILAAERYSVQGMVLKVDRSQKSFLVSHDSIPGFMQAMTMPFDVRDIKELNGLAPGTLVEFTLVVDRNSAYAERLRLRPYVTAEQDPLTARRLKLVKELDATHSARQLKVGQAVPDFALTDQARRSVSLLQFRGKVIAINFIYTSCALPQFCYRTANNFGAVERRFKKQMGRDLVLLTVTFDPARDQPERLAEYASQWDANPENWRFLTGAPTEISRVCGMFGVDYFPDEGLLSHSTRTALIDRQGNLLANLEGNKFNATQLGDLVETALKR